MIAREAPRTIVPERRSCVGAGGFLVGQLDGCTGETNKRCVWQRVTQVTRKAVDEIVLRAMRFIRDDHNVAALRQSRMAITFFFWQELLNRREDHTAGIDREFLTQVGTISGLYWWLTQEILAA